MNEPQFTRYQIDRKNTTSGVSENPNGNYVQYKEAMSAIEPLLAEVDRLQRIVKGHLHDFAMLSHSHNPSTVTIARQAINSANRPLSR